MKIPFPTSYIESPQSKRKYLSEEKYDQYVSDDSDIYGWTKIKGFEIPKQECTPNELKEVNPVINFSILGNSFLVPKELHDLVDEILDSQYILELENNWDQLGADKVDSTLFVEAISFLIFYSTHIFNVYGIIINSPEINPCRNGSIDFSWRTVGARMLINVRSKNGEVIATFFGYHKSNNLPIEGFIDTKKIDKTIASWMTELK